MKIECNLEKLKNAVSHAERATGKNLTLPILSSLLFSISESKLILRSTNLSLGIEIEIPLNSKNEEKGSFAIPGGLFSQYLGSITNEQNIELDFNNSVLTLKTKKNKTVFKTLPVEDFPTIPVVDNSQSVVLPVKKLVEGIKSVYYSSSLSEIKPEISSVYIYSDNDSVIFVSTDSFRLAEKRIKNKNSVDIGGVIIPFKNILEIIRILNDFDGDITINYNKNQISFTIGGLYLTSRLVDGIFPDYKQIIPKNHTTDVTVLKQDLLTALKVSNIFRDKFNQITLVVDSKSKSFTLISKNSDVGENVTSIDATINGDDIEVNFNFKYIIDCFQSINDDSITISFTQPNKPVIIKGVTDQLFTYLVMPMNR
jgi:DNA polymerase-3 subunit beta